MARVRRRVVHGVLVALALALLGPGLLAACATRSHDPKVVTYWTTITDPITMKAWRAIVAGFERDNPGYRVKLLAKPLQGTADATTLITAVRGRTAPDVYLVNRFTTAQYAASGLLTSLQPYVDRVPGMSRNYLPFAWREGDYDGRIYSIPNDTDSRGLYYNKDLLRQAGVDPAVLDPRHGPPTIEQVQRIAARVDLVRDGHYRRVGFIPWYGQGFWATWGLLFGAKYFDNAHCRVVLDDAGLRTAFDHFQQWARTLNYARTQAFLATYEPPGHPPNQGIFLNGNQGVQVDGNFALDSLRTYAPKLDFGVTYIPVAKKGDPVFTWSGGYAYVIPTGAANPDGGWKFIRYAAGAKGQRIYDTMTAHLPTYRSLLRDRAVIRGQEFFARLLAHSSSFLPPLPVNAQLFDALDNAQSAVLLGQSPRAALDAAASQVQADMKQYCPFRLPAG